MLAAFVAAGDLFTLRLFAAALLVGLGDMLGILWGGLLGRVARVTSIWGVLAVIGLEGDAQDQGCVQQQCQKTAFRNRCALGIPLPGNTSDLLASCF